MSAELKPARNKITAYQIFGWTPLLVTAIGANIVVALSIISQR